MVDMIPIAAVKRNPLFETLFSHRPALITHIAAKVREESGLDPAFPAVLWGNHGDELVDGYHRLEGGLAGGAKVLPVIRMDFPDDYGAVRFAMRSKVNRQHNLPDEEILAAARLLDKLARERAEKRQKEALDEHRPDSARGHTHVKQDSSQEVEAQRSAAEMAETLGISPRKVARARRVLAHPEKAAEVEAGKKSIRAADEEIRKESQIRPGAGAPADGTPETAERSVKPAEKQSPVPAIAPAGPSLEEQINGLIEEILSRAQQLVKLVGLGGLSEKLVVPVRQTVKKLSSLLPVPKELGEQVLWYAENPDKCSGPRWEPEEKEFCGLVVFAREYQKHFGRFPAILWGRDSGIMKKMQAAFRREDLTTERAVNAYFQHYAKNRFHQEKGWSVAAMIGVLDGLLLKTARAESTKPKSPPPSISREALAPTCKSQPLPAGEFWKSLLKALTAGKKPMIDEETFTVWFKKTRGIGFQGEALVVEVKNSAYRDFILGNYPEELTRVTESWPDIGILFCVAEDKLPYAPNEQEAEEIEKSNE